MILLGLGSNIGDREGNIRQAIQMLATTPGILIDRMSSFYATEPIGVTDQPEFINAVISIATNLPPGDLLKICLSTEAALGRIRQQRWGPRNIDIDILLYNDIILDLNWLTLPHPRLHERAFVLIPLQEIAPDLPVYHGKTATELLQTCDSGQVKWHSKLIF